MDDIRTLNSRPSGVDTTNPEIAAIWAKVRDDADPTNWVLLHCPSKTEINVMSYGDSGLDGLMSNLDPDKCLYGGLRCTVNGMIKMYSLYCAGENVGGKPMPYIDTPRYINRPYKV